jgi:hypothetical protein
MKVNILKESTESANQTRTQSREDYWTEAARISKLRHPEGIVFSILGAILVLFFWYSSSYSYK